MTGRSDTAAKERRVLQSYRGLRITGAGGYRVTGATGFTRAIGLQGTEVKECLQDRLRTVAARGSEWFQMNGPSPALLGPLNVALY